MLIVKNKRQQEILKKYGYNPDKIVQYVKTFPSRQAYINNIKSQFKRLVKLIVVLITTPLDIIIQTYMATQSLMWWCLVITKKNIDNSPIVVEGTFKNPNDVET